MKLCCFFILFMSFSAVLANQKPDDTLWLGPQSCAECHEDETLLWKHTHHASSFKKMPRTKEGKDIAKKLGVKRIKTDPACVTCHFTQVIKKGSRKLRSVSGVSCETCHGPAKNWIEIHHDYGGPKVTAKQETATHRKQRRKKSEAAGMVDSDDFYNAFYRCYRCHMVPDEKLVNKGGHIAGSDFELVAWSNGEIRHNVWHNQGKSNPIDRLPRQRIKYILGQALMLEEGLKGLAKSKKDGKYRQSMQKYITTAINQLSKINELKPIAPMAKSVAIGRQFSQDPNDSKGLEEAVKEINSNTHEFLKDYKDTDLSAIDPLLPKKFHGKPKKN